MTKKFWLTTVAIAIFIAGALALVIWNETRSVTTTSTPLTPSTPTTYTIAQIAAHNEATSCWTVIESNVYDLTTYIEKHPGGAAPILAACGKNGTEIFLSMPSAVLPVARLALKQYLVGSLTP